MTIATSATVGVALFGLGRAGSFHIQSLGLAAEEAQLRWVFDVDAEKRSAFARRAGCRAAADPREALADPAVDAVIVATPTQTHFGHVFPALEAGKAVLTEKPLGVSIEEIDRCFAAAAAGQPLFVAFQRRFDPSFAELVDRAHAGEIGKLQFVRSVSRDSPVPSLEYLRTSGGIFHDCVVHDLDMVCQIIGENPTRVAAFASNFLPEIRALDDFDNATVSLAFPGGALATIDVSRASAFGYDQRIEVFGDAGMIEAGNRPRTSVTRASSEGNFGARIDHSFPTRYRDAYLAELRAFLACVRDGKPAPISHAQVRLNHQLADAAEESARTNRVVFL